MIAWKLGVGAPFLVGLNEVTHYKDDPNLIKGEAES